MIGHDHLIMAREVDARTYRCAAGVIVPVFKSRGTHADFRRKPGAPLYAVDGQMRPLELCKSLCKVVGIVV